MIPSASCRAEQSKGPCRKNRAGVSSNFVRQGSPSALTKRTAADRDELDERGRRKKNHPPPDLPHETKSYDLPPFQTQRKHETESTACRKNKNKKKHPRKTKNNSPLLFRISPDPVCMMCVCACGLLDALHPTATVSSLSFVPAPPYRILILMHAHGWVPWATRFLMCPSVATRGEEKEPARNGSGIEGVYFCTMV